MLGFQSNSKESSQNYLINSQNHQLVQPNLLTYSNQDEFNKITELHRINGDIHILEAEISKKHQMIADICYKIKLFYEQKAKQRYLEAKEQKLQNELEQLQLFQDKLKKELKLISQEEQIKKGKMIVEHNKITQVKEQCNNEAKRRQLLLKHLQEIKKGSDVLRKKIKISKQDLKKANSGRPKLEQNALRAQVKKLMAQLEPKQKTLTTLLKQKQSLTQPKHYTQLVEKLQHLKQKCDNQPRLQERHQYLVKQKDQLQERLVFLKSVNVQLIDQKKSLIQKLSQKYTILQDQKRSLIEQLAKYQSQMLTLEQQQKENLSLMKKGSRRKRQPKSKHQQIQNQLSLEQETKQKQADKEQIPVNRWKGKLLKERCLMIFTFLGAMGILFGSVAGLYT